jgi:ABC-2 type transport system ATP-binding protein
VSDPILLVRNLCKKYGDAAPALDHLDLHVDRGEVLGLLGANGAGKTTAMNLLLGLTEPDEGTVRMFGLEFRRHRIAILRRVNFTSAYTNLPGNLLVWQNLLVFARLYKVERPRQKMEEMLELFEVSHLRNEVTGRLSAGEGTRVNLCKAFLNDPELLLLDEPTASLDPDIADKVRKTLRRLQKERGLTILYTSHNMKDIEEVCDRVIFLHRGRIVREGTPAGLMEQSGSLEDIFIRIARDGEIVEPPPLS